MITAMVFSSTLALTQALAHDDIVSAEISSDTVPGATEPLYSNLGNLTYPITTRSAAAQKYFDQGLRWTYAFNHDAALRAFREAQRQDPQCALCYWGEAFVLGPNINAPMDDSASNPAVTAVSKAQKLASGAKPNEQALIGALAKRYSDDAGSERETLNQAYAQAMADVAHTFPDDPEIAILYVDGLMNLSPWDYWEADGKTPKGRIGEAIAGAERVLAAYPNHPGAIHLYIHLTEASTTPERAEPYADRLAELMPGSGHLVHMGSHTFYRVGRYQDSAQLNKKAVAADEAYLANVEADGIYPYGYYPHNIHFVLASAQMAGDPRTAIDYAKRLEGKIPDEIAEQVGWIQAIRTAPYFAHAQLSDPDTTLALPDPGDKFPLIKAMWHYARGVAFAAKGDTEQARGEAARIAELGQSADFSHLLAWAVPAPDLLRLARHVIQGRIAQAEGNSQQAIKEFRTAVAIQDSLAYMEPPYWYYPVRQSLGAALVEAGKPAQAEKVFHETLDNFPNNGWALYGLMRAQQAQGRKSEAQETAMRLQQAWAGDLEQLNLKRL
jgi:tetratricopeptide (TPR) repeat protein